MPSCRKGIGIWLASKLNHRDHIHDEDLINVAPNDSNRGARPIRSLREDTKQIVHGDLTFSVDKQRVVRRQSAILPYIRHRDTIQISTVIDFSMKSSGLMSEPGERDKKRPGLVVTNTNLSLGAARARKDTLLLPLLPFVRYWGREWR